MMRTPKPFIVILFCPDAQNSSVATKQGLNNQRATETDATRSTFHLRLRGYEQGSRQPTRLCWRTRPKPLRSPPFCCHQLCGLASTLFTWMEASAGPNSLCAWQTEIAPHSLNIVGVAWCDTCVFSFLPWIRSREQSTCGAAGLSLIRTYKHWLQESLSFQPLRSV